MPLRPEEVRARRFRTGLLGYRKRDVVSFLREVAWDYKTTLEERSVSDPVTDEGREVERLWQCTQESTEVLRLLAALELRREEAGTAARDDALAGYRLYRAAHVLSAAADALERARGVVRRKNEVVGAGTQTASEPMGLDGGPRSVARAGGHQITVAPPPPPGVSTSVHASG